MAWLVTGESESGDDYSVIFDNEPTDEQLSQFVHYADGWWTASYESLEDMLAHDDGGPGHDDSWVHITIEDQG